MAEETYRPFRSPGWTVYPSKAKTAGRSIPLGRSVQGARPKLASFETSSLRGAFHRGYSVGGKNSLDHGTLVFLVQLEETKRRSVVYIRESSPGPIVLSARSL